MRGGEAGHDLTIVGFPGRQIMAPVLNAGLVALWFSSIAKEPFSFVIFQGDGGQDPCHPPPPLDLHMSFVVRKQQF